MKKLLIFVLIIISVLFIGCNNKNITGNNNSNNTETGGNGGNTDTGDGGNTDPGTGGDGDDTEPTPEPTPDPNEISINVNEVSIVNSDAESFEKVISYQVLKCDVTIDSKSIVITAVNNYGAAADEYDISKVLMEIYFITSAEQNIEKGYKKSIRLAPKSNKTETSVNEIAEDVIKVYMKTVNTSTATAETIANYYLVYQKN